MNLELTIVKTKTYPQQHLKSTLPCCLVWYKYEQAGAEAELGQAQAGIILYFNFQWFILVELVGLNKPTLLFTQSKSDLKWLSYDQNKNYETYYRSVKFELFQSIF